MFTFIPSQKKGFTLIEMVVSIALFTLVAVVALGALLKIIDANNKSQAIKSTINNLNFALESMSREMRVGTKYYCDTETPQGNQLNLFENVSLPATLTGPRSCGLTGLWVIAFESSERYPRASPPNSFCNLIHAYWFPGYKLMKWEQPNCETDADEDDFYPVIGGIALGSGDDNSDDILINFDAGIIKVVSEQVESEPDIQPYAQIRFKGTANSLNKKTESTFDIQTTISQRLLD